VETARNLAHSLPWRRTFDTISLQEIRFEFGKSAALQCRACSPHQSEIKVQVVECDQAKPKNFLSFEEMPDVAAREFPAGRAAATCFDRPLI
jgi:hypothetical protein